MKQDPYFKYVAAVLLAGVILAILNPPARPEPAPLVTATAAAAVSTKS